MKTGFGVFTVNLIFLRLNRLNLRFRAPFPEAARRNPQSKAGRLESGPFERLVFAELYELKQFERTVALRLLRMGIRISKVLRLIGDLLEGV